jgi:hypothetical protein
MKHDICNVVLALFLPVMPIGPALAQGWVQPPPEGSETQVLNVGSGLCLVPEYEARINGLAIVQQPCIRTDSWHRWEFLILPGFQYGQDHPGIYLVNNAPHLLGGPQCLDDRDGKTADWSPVQQWPCNFTSTTMQWKLVALGDQDSSLIQFINMRSRKCLDVRGGSLAPGAALQIYRCTSTVTSPNWAQLFRW